MARKFLVPIDLNGNTLLSARLHPQGSAPTSPTPTSGQVWYDDTNKVLKIYDGAAWQPAGSASTGAGAPSSTPSSVGSLYWDTTNSTLYVAGGTSSSADWKPAQAYGTTPANLSTAAAAGTSLKVAREDHVHRHTNTDHSAINISALAAPTADVAWGTYKITGLGDPTNAQDAATKAYVDAVKTGLDVKDSVRVATTANITLSGTQTVDGVAVVAGDRVLVKDQSTGSQNGIYVVAAGAWSRATDADANAEVTAGLFVFVAEGTTNADSGWVLTTNDAITVGTTALTFVQFSGAGQVTAGAGLTKSGNTLDVGTASTARIVVNADNIDLATVTRSNTAGTAGVNFIQSFTTDSYGRVTASVAADVRDATTSAKGIASFSSTDFSVSSGAVSLNTVGIGKGGTGLTATPTNGQLLIGNGTGFTLATLTAGTGITVTNSTGSITLTNAGVTALTGTSNQVTVSASTGSVTLSLPQSIATASTPQFAGLGIGGTAPATGITVAAGKTTLASSTATAASLNIVSGTAPSAPASGDIWVASDALNYRTSGGATKAVLFADLSNVSGTLAVANGGTGAANATGARTNLGAAASGANSDITSLSGLTTALSVGQGGTGATTAAGARTNLGATTKVTGTNTLGTSYTVNHGLGQWVHVQVYETSTGIIADCDITNAATNGGTTTIAFTNSQTAGAYTHVIIG